MPSRTIKESHRPRVSDRTMHCHSLSEQSSGLLFHENDGAVTNSEMEPQGRTIASPSRTRRQSKTPCLEKTTLRVRNYVQTVGLNAETKKDRHRAEGETFVLTFPFIGLYRLGLTRNWFRITRPFRKLQVSLTIAIIKLIVMLTRHERREKERELRKREENLRKEEERRKREAPLPSRLKRLGQAAIAVVTFVFAAVGYYAIARPHVSIEPSLSLNPVNPYLTQFLVKNENPIFEVHDVHCVCWPRRMESANNFSVLSFAPLQNVQHTIPELSPGASSTVDCPPVIGGIGAWSGEVADAELEIVASYKQTWWPWSVTERNAFASRRDSQRGVHWVHITPGEEKSLIPQR
jgi:hypothetical protein